MPHYDHGNIWIHAVHGFVFCCVVTQTIRESIVSLTFYFQFQLLSITDIISSIYTWPSNTLYSILSTGFFLFIINKLDSLTLTLISIYLFSFIYHTVFIKNLTV